MWQVLQMGLIGLAVCFGGNLLTMLAMIELAAADQANQKPPNGGRLVVTPAIAAA